MLSLESNGDPTSGYNIHPTGMVKASMVSIVAQQGIKIKVIKISHSKICVTK